MDPGCCPHCPGTNSRLISIDRRLDKIAESLVELQATFAPVKKLVYGAVGTIGLTFMGGLAMLAWRALGL